MVELRKLCEDDAEVLFALTDLNRQYLREWLPWLDAVTSVEDSRDFLIREMERESRGEGLVRLIVFGGEVTGLVGFVPIDHVNGVGHLGYWLGEDFTGKGLMGDAVRKLMVLGRRDFALQRIELRCAVGNVRSRGVAERLGFVYEGTLRRVERVYDRWMDHEVWRYLF